MDSNMKRELVAQMVPAVGVPLLRAGLNHHYTMKEMDKRKEMEVEMAERRQQGIHAMAKAKRGEVAAGGGVRSEPVGGTGSVGPSTGGDGDVYDELESLKEETQCQFCHSVANELMDAPPGEAREGLDELRSFVREQERIEGQDIDESEAERIVGDLVERWSVVPKYAVSI